MSIEGERDMKANWRTVSVWLEIAMRWLGSRPTRYPAILAGGGFTLAAQPWWAYMAEQLFDRAVCGGQAAWCQPSPAAFAFGMFFVMLSLPAFFASLKNKQNGLSPGDRAQIIVTRATGDLQTFLNSSTGLEERLRLGERVLQLTDELIQSIPESPLAHQLQSGANVIGMRLNDLRSEVAKLSAEVTRIRHEQREKAQAERRRVDLVDLLSRSLDDLTIRSVVETTRAIRGELAAIFDEAKYLPGHPSPMHKAISCLMENLFKAGAFDAAMAVEEEFGLRSDVAVRAGAALACTTGDYRKALRICEEGFQHCRIDRTSTNFAKADIVAAAFANNDLSFAKETLESLRDDRFYVGRLVLELDDACPVSDVLSHIYPLAPAEVQAKILADLVTGPRASDEVRSDVFYRLCALEARFAHVLESQRADFSHLLGRAFAGCGDSAKALQWLDACQGLVSAQPDNVARVQLRMSLAGAYRSLGQPFEMLMQASRNDIDTSYHHYPRTGSSPNGSYPYVRGLVELGMFAEAEEFIGVWRDEMTYPDLFSYLLDSAIEIDPARSCLVYIDRIKQPFVRLRAVVSGIVVTHPNHERGLENALKGMLGAPIPVVREAHNYKPFAQLIAALRRWPASAVVSREAILRSVASDCSVVDLGELAACMPSLARDAREWHWRDRIEPRPR